MAKAVKDKGRQTSAMSFDTGSETSTDFTLSNVYNKIDDETKELAEVENVCLQLETRFKDDTPFSECDINQLLENQHLLAFLMNYWKVFCVQFEATRHKIVLFDEENPTQMSISLIGTLWSSDLTVGEFNSGLKIAIKDVLSKKYPRNPIDYDYNLKIEFHSDTPSRQINDALKRPKAKIIIISESIELDFWMKNLHNVSHQSPDEKHDQFLVKEFDLKYNWRMMLVVLNSVCKPESAQEIASVVAKHRPLLVVYCGSGKSDKEDVAFVPSNINLGTKTLSTFKTFYRAIYDVIGMSKMASTIERSDSSSLILKAIGETAPISAVLYHEAQLNNSIKESVVVTVSTGLHALHTRVEVHISFKDSYIEILKALPSLLNESNFRISSKVLGITNPRKLVYLTDLLSFELIRKWYKESKNKYIGGLQVVSLEIHPIDDRFDLRSMEDIEKIKIVVEEKVIQTLSSDEAKDLKDFTQHNKLIIGGGESRALKNNKSHSALGESLSDETLTSHISVLASHNLDVTLKMIIIGESTVGKTSLLLRYVDHTFLEKTESERFEYKTKMLTDPTGKGKVNLLLNDTGGQERFRELTASFFRGSDGVIIVYDISNQDSWEAVPRWYEYSKKVSPSHTAFILIGNKLDLAEKRVVPYEKAKNFATSKSMQYIETSAKEGTGVSTAFTAALNIALAVKEAKLVSKDTTAPSTYHPSSPSSSPPPRKKGFFSCCK